MSQWHFPAVDLTNQLTILTPHYFFIILLIVRGINSLCFITFTVGKTPI